MKPTVLFLFEKTYETNIWLKYVFLESFDMTCVTPKGDEVCIAFLSTVEMENLEMECNL